MSEENVNSGLNLLTNNMPNGVLTLSNETLDLLKQKHPESEKHPNFWITI